MQSTLRADLGDVRILQGPAAQTFLDRVGGDAATSGHHIAMRPEATHAATLPGRVMLLHELMHVAQQGRRGQASDPEGNNGAREERDAQEAALWLATKPPLPIDRYAQ